jgi:hypothetical protein
MTRLPHYNLAGNPDMVGTDAEVICLREI